MSRSAPPDLPDDLPPASTLRALDEQNTPHLRHRVRRFAAYCIMSMRAAGIPIPPNYATEMVEDAITDTRVGLKKWDPDRCPLYTHLRRMILKQTSKELKRARRFARVAFVPGDHDDPMAEVVDRACAPAAAAEMVPPRLTSLVVEVVDLLDRHAHDHPDSLAIVSCWRDGLVEREEILARTGLTERAYQIARQRVMNLVDLLPTELRDRARDLLRSVP